MTLGVDEGFHNQVLYSGQLHKVLNVKMFPQGEGPANNLGGFAVKPSSVVKLDLKAWSVLRGNKPNQTVHNWNGDISPVVHHYSLFK